MSTTWLQSVEARSRAEAADARALRAVTTGSSAQMMKVEAFRMLQTL